MSTDQEAPGTELALAGSFPLYNPDDDFRKLALDTYYVSEGFRLVDKDELIGVPFIVKRVVWREGFPRNGVEGDYVSCECIVADRDTLDSEPIKRRLPSPLTVYGNEPVVFNDSGTGCRRRMTRLVHEAMLIDVGQPGTPKEEFQNEFDKPFQTWASGAGMAQAGIGGSDLTPAKGGLYLALRGLRRSEYDWHGQDAVTYYFA